MQSEELIRLARLVQQGKADARTVAVKAAHERCPVLYETLSSFSNQEEGGVLLFGLDADNECEVTGVYDAQALQLHAAGQCEQMEPKVRPVFTTAELDGRTICSAEIPGLGYEERPCYYIGKGRSGGTFTRVGREDLPMTDFELYSFEAYRSHQHEDRRPIPSADISLLDPQMVQRFLLEKKANRPGLQKIDEGTLSELLGITAGGKPTLAAILAFGIFPQAVFPRLAISAARVPGREIGEMDADGNRFTDSELLEGTIPEQLEGAIRFCLKTMKKAAHIDSRTGRRVDRTEYPTEAIREAVLNALLHRDYSPYTEGTPIQLNLFDDRMEIHSPGMPYGGFQVDQPDHIRPAPRNPLLAALCGPFSAPKRNCSGIPAIRRAMREQGLPEPEFQNRRNEFVVILRNRPFGSEPSPTKKR